MIDEAHGYVGAAEALRERTRNPEFTTQSGGLWVRCPAPTQPCVLIQSHPGSGTHSFVNWLHWQHMLVAHENVGAGTEDLIELVVSFRYLRHTDAFRRVQLMVRHPLHTIYSAAGLFRVRADLINVLQNDIPGWAWPGHPLKGAALSWLRFDEAAFPLTRHGWFRREDVDTSEAPPDGRGWNKTTAPGLNTHRYPGERSWARLEAFAGTDLVRRIRERAEFYGYE